ncbi:hypothetical protein KEJ25_01905 [Candidatus Bathyarchaeota archaeon]|nr:hypothetical protein [Candidatus Bathyarchaeota archaeon]
MIRNLTGLEREILLAMLNLEEERSEMLKGTALSGMEIMVAPSTVAEAILENRMRADGVKVRDAGIQMGIYVATGFMEFPSAVREFRSLTESVRQCMERLRGRRLLLKMTPESRKGGYLATYVLSPMGRLLAERVKAETDQEMDKFLWEAVNRLWRERVSGSKPPYATPEEILETLWHIMQGLYGNDRELFNKYWNRVTVGRNMRRGGYELVRRRLNGKLVWVYDLYGLEDQKRDLAAALAALKNRSFRRVGVRRIVKALWDTCGAKFKSRDVLEKVWDGKRVGMLMERLKADESKELHTSVKDYVGQST